MNSISTQDRLAVWLLIMFDAVATYYVVSIGMATEAAILMKAAFGIFGMLPSLIARQVVATWVLFHKKTHRILIVIVGAVYGLLAIFHVIMYLTHNI